MQSTFPVDSGSGGVGATDALLPDEAPLSQLLGVGCCGLSAEFRPENEPFTGGAWRKLTSTGPARIQRRDAPSTQAQPPWLIGGTIAG